MSTLANFKVFELSVAKLNIFPCHRWTWTFSYIVLKLKRPCKTEPLCESHSVDFLFLSMIWKGFSPIQGIWTKPRPPACRIYKKRGACNFILSVKMFSLKKKYQVLTPKKCSPHIVWHLWGYAQGSWGLRLYEGGIGI